MRISDWSSDVCAADLQGVNDLPRTLTTTTYDLLRAIRRGTGGRDYTDLHAALSRLETTSIRPSLRAPKRRTEAQFGWLDEWSLEADPETELPRGMIIKIGRANVWTPVAKPHLVCRLLLENKREHLRQHIANTNI